MRGSTVVNTAITSLKPSVKVSVQPFALVCLLP